MDIDRQNNRDNGVRDGSIKLESELVIGGGTAIRVKTLAGAGPLYLPNSNQRQRIMVYRNEIHP
jgi:hypothetical protein